MAGVPGFEPGLTVLETAVLAANTIPLSCPSYRSADHQRNALLAFLVIGVRSAMVAELLEGQPIRRLLLVLGRHVIAILASRALQNYVISCHNRFYPSVNYIRKRTRPH